MDYSPAMEEKYNKIYSKNIDSFYNYMNDSTLENEKQLYRQERIKISNQALNIYYEFEYSFSECRTYEIDCYVMIGNKISTKLYGDWDCINPLRVSRVCCNEKLHNILQKIESSFNEKYGNISFDEFLILFVYEFKLHEKIYFALYEAIYERGTEIDCCKECKVKQNI